MLRSSRHPGPLAAAVAVAVVAVAYLSGVAAAIGSTAPLWVTLAAALAGGVVAGSHTDLLRVGFPPGFLAFLVASVVFEPAGAPSVADVLAVAQYLLPFAVLAGCVSAIVAVVLDHRVFVDAEAEDEAAGE